MNISVVEKNGVNETTNRRPRRQRVTVRRCSERAHAGASIERGRARSCARHRLVMLSRRRTSNDAIDPRKEMSSSLDDLGGARANVVAARSLGDTKIGFSRCSLRGRFTLARVAPFSTAGVTEMSVDLPLAVRMGFGLPKPYDETVAGKRQSSTDTRRRCSHSLRTVDTTGQRGQHHRHEDEERPRARSATFRHGRPPASARSRTAPSLSARRRARRP